MIYHRSVMYLQNAVNCVRSLLYFLAQDYKVDPQRTHSLSRAEQICGEYLSLVEVYCRTQHTVEWYASHMCLAPKYLSNVVKQTLNLSPNACIDKALTRQAKSLLSKTKVISARSSNAKPDIALLPLEIR